MRNITYVLAFAVFLVSCDTKTTNRNNETGELQLKDSSAIFGNHLVAYNDSVPVYKSPSETSKIIGFLRELLPVLRYDYYVCSNGVYAKFDISASWIPIRFNNDTGWVNRFDNVSLRYDVDTIKNIVILNKTSIADIVGVGYINTQVRNIKTKKNIINQFLNLEYCYLINDSLYIFSLGTDSIKIYNLKTDLFIYESIGAANTFCKETNHLYYLRWSKDSISPYGYHILTDSIFQLMQYDIYSNTDKVLYIESDIQQRPYVWGPDYRSLTAINFTKKNNSRFISFKLFKMRPNPVDEGDFDTRIIELKIDND